MGQDSEWQPRLLGFLCRWCSYAGADLAGTSRKKYPASIRVIRVPCSGRVDPLFILKALRLGFDGVLVSGCHPGDCHYQTGNYFTRRRMAITKRFLEYMGIDPRRLQASWVSASEGGKFAELVTEMTREIRELGPNRLFTDEERDDGTKTAP
jgi:F420-non-reducing hydrogenase iron-sulfur subunit